MNNLQPKNGQEKKRKATLMKQRREITQNTKKKES
jgi:hypothetical protein